MEDQPSSESTPFDEHWREIRRVIDAGRADEVLALACPKCGDALRIAYFWGDRKSSFPARLQHAAINVDCIRCGSGERRDGCDANPPWVEQLGAFITTRPTRSASQQEADERLRDPDLDSRTLYELARKEGFSVLNACRLLRDVRQLSLEECYEVAILCGDAKEPVRQNDRSTTPCPYCGQPLRTDQAKQCFECGSDWHGLPAPRA